MTDDEIKDIRRAAASYRDDLIIQLGAYVGLRAFEIPQIQPQQIKETENGAYRLRIPRGRTQLATAGNHVMRFSRPTLSAPSNSTRIPRTLPHEIPISI